MPSEWVVVGVDVGGAYWPDVEVEIPYRGRVVKLRPPTDTAAPTVVLGREQEESFEDGLLFLRRFLSALCWARREAVNEILATGGSHPFQIGWSGRPSFKGSPKFRLDYLPEPDNPKAILALALYREAKGLDSLPYRFLGFAKILNVRFETSAQQKAWINTTIENLEDHWAQTRVAELRQQGVDVGDYLYGSGRCAIAHAYSEPLVDPERPEDTQRLAKDLPVVEALGEYLIEHAFSIKSSRTIWREHLYELAGFRELLGPDLTGRLRAAEPIGLEELPALPRLSLRVRGLRPEGTFEGLTATILEVENGRLLVRCDSPFPRVAVGLGFNFKAERLEFDPDGLVAIADDGSVEVVAAALEEIRLVRALLLNGQFEVWNADSGDLLGRTDPYIPQNVDMHVTLDNLEATEQALESLRQERTDT